MNIQRTIRAEAAYDTDFTAWLLEQAARLRARDTDALDWDNLAEEIEDMGLNHHRELASRLRVILTHMIKLSVSQDEQPRAGWRAAIATQRAEIDDLLKQSPSLRRRVADAAENQFIKAASLALKELEPHEPHRMATYRVLVRDLSPIDAEHLLDEDWFPDPPVTE